MYGPHEAQGGSSTGCAPPVSSVSPAVNESREFGHTYPGYSRGGENYAYGSTNYQGYNYGYLQQGNLSLSQNTTGAYENSGAPYQPSTSFQNTNSTPYQNTVTYYNAGVYQSTGAYQNTGYSGHPGSWDEAGYCGYSAYSGYPGHTPPEPSGTAISDAVPTHSQYQDEYPQQWADYYAGLQDASQADLDEDTHAPGTEPDANSISETPNVPNVPLLASAAASVQPPPPGTQSTWQQNGPIYSRPANSQALTAGPANNGGFWVCTDQYETNSCHFQLQPYIQQNLQEQSIQGQQAQKQQSLVENGQHLQNRSTRSPGNSSESYIPEVTTSDTSHKKIGKLQIATNPRIAPTLSFASINSIKPSSADSAQSHNPAYLSVSGKTLKLKVSSADDVADAMLKPGMFPHSLRAYVERALSRCQDDVQKVACQNIMKEMITQASSEGWLFTKDWDTEPLFALPSASVLPIAKEYVQNVKSSTVKLDKSPVRRSKSRWEPVIEDKPEEKHAHLQTHNVTREGIWDRLKEGDALVSATKWEKQEGIWNNTKLLLQQQLPNLKKPNQMIKRARQDAAGTYHGGDSSSGDSEEEVVQGGGIYLGMLGATETPDEKRKRQSRTKRFDSEIETNTGYTSIVRGKVRLGASARRATALLLAKSYEDGSGAVEDINWDALTVKGTCQEVEKKYLRLTSAPDPSTVRPEEVLKIALAMIQRCQKNYIYKCEQLKSIRQDLTVQRIRNELTVEVYETHARTALEAGDLPEYNQCQSQLKGLYAEGIKGCHFEFAAYSLLYIIVQQGSNQDLLSSMSRLSKEAKEDDAVKHALAVRAAVATGNYTSFFRLYRTAPNLNPCFMDFYVEKMRFEAVRCMARSYRPSLPIGFIARTLGFTCLELASNKQTDAVDECEDWLRAHGAHLIDSQGTGELQLDCKVSATGLFLPEADEAVAHVDMNLAVNNFLTQA